MSTVLDHPERESDMRDDGPAGVQRKPRRRFLWKPAASRGSLALIGLVGCLGYFQVIANWVLIAGLLAVLLYEFQSRIDKGIPLLHVAALIATLQWLVGPVWFYLGDLEAGQMGMRNGPEEYFHYAIAGTAAFVFGLLTFSKTNNQKQLLKPVDHSEFLQIGLFLNVIALAAEIGGRFLPGQLQFAAYLVSQVRYVGCLYILCSGNAWRIWIVVACMAPLLKGSAATAMFHDLLLWSGIMGCFWFSTSTRRLRDKFAVVLAAAFAAFTIQVVKESYREKMWHGDGSSLTGEIFGFWANSRSKNWDNLLSGVMVRLNQGWIISAIMVHVPGSEPFAEGETVVDAVVAAVLPRLIAEDKQTAGGRTNFQRFTGIPISDKTSMNMSMLGEGYANFGIEGGVLFMGVLGSALAMYFSAALKFCRRFPTFIFWVPVIFYEAIRAETALAEVLNHMTKATLVVFVLFMSLQVVFPDSPGKRTRRRAGRRQAGRQINRERAIATAIPD